MGLGLGGAAGGVRCAAGTAHIVKSSNGGSASIRWAGGHCVAEAANGVLVWRCQVCDVHWLQPEWKRNAAQRAVDWQFYIVPFALVCVACWCQRPTSTHTRCYRMLSSPGIGTRLYVCTLCRLIRSADFAYAGTSRGVRAVN